MYHICIPDKISFPMIGRIIGKFLKTTKFKKCCFVTVPEVKNFKTPGKPYLLNYCIECDEIWSGNVFLGVLPCLRFSMWSDELFLQLLNVTFFSQSDHTIGFCEKFPWIWKKINFLRPTVQKLWLFEVFGLEGV